jgi:hypothetical protein
MGVRHSDGHQGFARSAFADDADRARRVQVFREPGDGQRLRRQWLAQQRGDRRRDRINGP